MHWRQILMTSLRRKPVRGYGTPCDQEATDSWQITGGRAGIGLTLGTDCDFHRSSNLAAICWDVN